MRQKAHHKRNRINTPKDKLSDYNNCWHPWCRKFIFGLWGYLQGI